MKSEKMAVSPLNPPHGGLLNPKETGFFNTPGDFKKVT